MSKVCGSVEGIDVPDEFPGTLGSCALFSHNSVIRKCCAKSGDNQLLRCPVRIGDYIDRSHTFVFRLDTPGVVLHKQRTSASCNVSSFGDLVGVSTAHRRPRHPVSSAI